MSCVLGLTGMTGAGKSTVARYFEKSGARIIDADAIARQAVSDRSVIKELCAQFGNDILDENGRVKRDVLAQKAFSSESAAQRLSDITHPYILSVMRKRAEEYKSAGADIIIMDAPLLYQSGADIMCDKVIFVDADEAVKRCRIMKRDKLTLRQAKDRIGVQKGMKEYEKRADFVIYNNGDLTDLYLKCDNIIEGIC